MSDDLDAQRTAAAGGTLDPSEQRPVHFDSPPNRIREFRRIRALSTNRPLSV
ncbi:hypothetical protein [Haloprofundus salilacus]|uniref:hypothetical protein n=1 Tax=Haloprofundus salilacus TaxID=2876190 RepID=UPI001CD02FCC|nr:hypothetical protein [Haloprofundus salilacus]